MPPACPARLLIPRMRPTALSGYSLLATANALAQPTRPYRQARDQAEHHADQQAGAGADHGGFERRGKAGTESNSREIANRGKSANIRRIIEPYRRLST